MLGCPVGCRRDVVVLARALPRASKQASRCREALHAAGTQVYAASIMFGYFVRRVDKRFQLERSAGMLPQTQEEAVARLERLFSQARRPHGASPAHHALASSLATPQST